jgi:hypothetical protein
MMPYCPTPGYFCDAENISGNENLGLKSADLDKKWLLTHAARHAVISGNTQVRNLGIELDPIDA